MSCPDCTAAAQRSHWMFTAGCRGCIARGVARLPQFRKVRDAGVLDRAYRQLLEQAGVTHDEVKRAAAADFEQRAQAERGQQRRAA